MNLLQVTTVMNLVAILYTECMINMADETSLELNKQQFEGLTDKLLQAGGGEGEGGREGREGEEGGRERVTARVIMC